MVYLLFALLLLTIVVMLSVKIFKKKQKILKEQLINQWGKAKTEPFDFDKITIYAELNKDNKFHQLSAQTKTDIDFNDIFCLLDRTTSRVGQQYLYAVLSNPTNNETALRKLNDQVNFFSDNEELRINVQLQLLHLNNEDAYFIPTLLTDNFFAKPAWNKFVFATLILIPVFAGLSFFYPAVLFCIVALLMINVFFHYRNKIYTKRFNKLFQQLNLLINCCKNLSYKQLPFDNSLIESTTATLKSFQKKTKLISFDGVSIKDEITQVTLYFYELFKALFLIEFFAFYSILKEIDKKQETILYLFNYIGAIDTAISIASLRAANLPICQPEFLPPSKQFSSTKTYHPLIENCVTNNINVHTKSVLITGSNMSGKTTFLRTLALNSVLAQTIFTCFAESFKTPFIKLHSSVRIDDNLLDGKSYYFEEVSVMAALIKQADQQWQNIFILDEVFKGTNTIERIASAKAILSYLNKKNNLVFVSTHDVELSALLAAEYELYHFAETINANGLHFDHLLKAGALTTTNAIKILALANYPNQIIKEAKNISERLLRLHKKVNDEYNFN